MNNENLNEITTEETVAETVNEATVEAPAVVEETTVVEPAANSQQKSPLFGILSLVFTSVAFFINPLCFFGFLGLVFALIGLFSKNCSPKILCGISLALCAILFVIECILAIFTVGVSLLI